MPKINSPGIRYISVESRHILWNWQQSPDSPDLARYHVIVVDDKKRDATLEGIFQQIQTAGFSVEKIRRAEGNVGNSKLKYLFVSFDTPARIDIIDWTKIGKIAKQDTDLYERKRKGFSIESYVEDIYS